MLIETKHLCKHYRAGTPAKVRALDDVSLGIERGSLTVVMGPSGSGKTTLLALLGALERPTRGCVLFDDIDLSSCSDAELARVRRRCGFIFQDFCLIPSLSVEDNIAYPLIPRGMPGPERRRRAQTWLMRFGLADKQFAPARELSGGEQQRVAIARALAGEPEVIFADEPTSNLDASVASTLLTVFQELNRAGSTLILASHDPQILPLGLQILELEHGKLSRGC